MNKSNIYHKLLTGGGRCKALLTLVMLMLLTLATSARVLAEENPKPYAVFDNKTGTLTFYWDNQFNKFTNPMELNEGTTDPKWKQYASEITTVEFNPLFQYARPKTCYKWFNGCTNLTEIKGIQYLNTSQVTNMEQMFEDCESLKSLDLSSFNTAKVTNMSGMFFGCSALETILVGSSGWNVDMVKQSNYMFSSCKKLTGGNGTTYQDGNPNGKTYARIDGMNGRGYFTSLEQCTPHAVLEDSPDGGMTLVFRYGYKPDNAKPLNEGTADPVWNQDASEITTVEFDPLFKYARPKTCYKWFYECSNLTEIKGIKYLNTSEVTNMYSMFTKCSSLQSLDLSSFNTAKVDDMESMFEDCESLKSLDLSSFNTASVTVMDLMFNNCSALETILVGSGWNVDEVTSSDNMFTSCLKLVGGSGTYRAYKTDITYAVIDGKDGNPGYLTLNALTLTNENGSTTAVLNGDFTDGSGAALIIDKEIKVDALTFNRSFTKKVTATVMFPFSFKTSDDIKGTFHTVTKVGPDENGVWTAELSDAITDIQANTPYIFSPSEDIAKSITFKNITLVPNNEILPNGTNGWQLKGVYSKRIWKENLKFEYGFAGQAVDDIQVGEFVRAGEGAWADPMRCYLTYGDGFENPFTAKAATVLPDRIRVVFPSDNNEETTDPEDPEDVITPVSTISETAGAKVWAYNRTIFIESAPDTDYSIIDLGGRVIKTSATQTTHEEITINNPGVYVVVINGKAYKLWLNYSF